MTNKKSVIVWLLLFVGIIVFAVWVQSQIIINHDNFTLLQVTQKFLHGGRYYYNFFDVNPPMILYVYMPPVIFSEIFHLDVYLAFRIYIFVIALFVLMICNVLLKSPQEFNQPGERYAIITALLFTFVLLFPVSLGQREHLTFMLIMPYLILANMRCREEQINSFICIVVGILAGVGLAFKPQFLIPLIFVEFYLIVRCKKIFLWLRPETVAIGLLWLVYFIVILVFTPEYLFKMLPLLSGIYYSAYPFSFYRLLSYFPFVFFLLSYFCFYLLYRKIYHRTLTTVLFVASLGFVIVYFIQNTGWQYHYLPAYGLVTLLDLILVYELVTQIFLKTSVGQSFPRSKAVFITALLGLIIFSPIQLMRYNVHKNLLSSNLQKTKAIKLLIKTYGGPNRSIYLFSPFMTDRLLLIKYAKGNIRSRFEIPLYLIVGLNNALRLADDNKTKQKLLIKKKHLVNLIVDDLQKASPKLIFYIYDVDFFDKIDNYQIRLLHINYFLQNNRFLNIMKQYKYFARTNRFVVYKKVKTTKNRNSKT